MKLVEWLRLIQKNKVSFSFKYEDSITYTL